MLVLWSLQANHKQESSFALSFHFTFLPHTNGQPSFKTHLVPVADPQRLGSCHWGGEKKSQGGRVFMSLSPWSTFERWTVNEPLVMFRLLMNVITNILSRTKVQRPGKDHLYSLRDDKALWMPSPVSRSPTSQYRTLEMPIGIKVTHPRSRIHLQNMPRLWSNTQTTVSLTHRCHCVTASP